MAGECADPVPGSIVESLALVIEFTGSQIKHSPETLNRVLNSPAVQKKIKEALEKRLGELQQKALSGRPVDSAQGLQAIKNVFAVDTLDATTKELKSELEKSSQFRKLKANLGDLSCRFKDRPLGTFWDERNGILIIVAAGVVVAGAVGLYVSETGDKDTPLLALAKLAELPAIPLGIVDVSLADIVLKPSEKQYDAGLAASISNWKAIEKVELKIVVQTKDETVSAIPVSVEAKVGVAPGWFSTVGGTYELKEKKANFSLGIVGTTGGLSVQIKANVAVEEKKQSVGGEGKVQWKPLPGVPMTITGGFGAQRVTQTLPTAFSGGDTKQTTTDLNVNVGLKIDF